MCRMSCMASSRNVRCGPSATGWTRLFWTARSARRRAPNGCCMLARCRSGSTAFLLARFSTSYRPGDSIFMVPVPTLAEAISPGPISLNCCNADPAQLRARRVRGRASGPGLVVVARRRSPRPASPRAARTARAASTARRRGRRSSPRPWRRHARVVAAAQVTTRSQPARSRASRRRQARAGPQLSGSAALTPRCVLSVPGSSSGSTAAWCSRSPLRRSDARSQP